MRLKPVLTAGQVGTNATGISGQIVNGATQLPIALGVNGTVLVALEQPDATGTDVIFEQTLTDSNGNFNFCPLPVGATFDVVAVAIDGSGTAYNATVAANVPGGSNLGKIPLAAETGAATGPTTFQGIVTATTGPASANADVAVSALQSISLPGSVSRDVTIPAESTSVASSNPVLSLTTTTACPGGAPANSNCAIYNLIEPASNPRVGVFSSGSISSYAQPVAGNVAYKVRAIASVPLSGGTADCSPSSATTLVDGGGNPLKAAASTTVFVKEIDLSGCS
jgi:hypothetical protein